MRKYTYLPTFVEKVSNFAISRFLMASFGTFWNFMLVFGIFFALFGSFGPFTLFFVNFFCHNLHTFLGKIMLAINIVSFSMSGNKYRSIL